VGTPTAERLPFSETHRFRVLSKLGEGGMGVVYEALDRKLRTRVALKTLRTMSAEAILRIKNEFRGLADLHHQNLVTLGELFEEDGLWFFTMELVEGVDLLRHVRPHLETRALPTTVGDSEVRGTNRTIDLWDTARSATSPGPAQPPAPAPLGAAAFEEGRLRAALVQVARGLSALHAAGKVHRDVKPSNIVVTAEGRLVILDFGLIASAGGQEDVAERRLVGTAPYMAPEQAATLPVGAPADWYSVGVVLYQALVGRVPFDGPLEEVLDAKRRFDPPPPSQLVSGVPADLDALCVRLLSRDPAARPSGADVLGMLGAESPADVPSLSAAPFVGRRAELAVLAEALGDSRKEALTVVITGESGVGKSALVRRFVEVEAAAAGCLVLSGRCYERESVPYKAIDGVVDALSRRLTSLRSDELGALLPRYASALGQVFPVVRRVEALADAPGLGQMEPRELRGRAFHALRELFERLGRRQPLVVTIDDFQWADADSLELLAEVMRSPGAPPLLLILTMRSAPASAAVPFGPSRRLDLGSLPHDESVALARQLFAALSSPAGNDIGVIADEAGGHPLFIGELVRRRLTAGDERSPLRLEDALWSRIRRLEPAAQSLVELVVVAGGPVPADVAAEAAGLDPGDFGRLVALLRAEHLLRSGAATDAIEPYHDRVGAAVLAHLAPEKKAELHRRLARALEAPGGVEPETLAVHCQGAGEAGAAAGYMEKAGDQAAQALAFGRAARLYRLASDLGRPTGEPARRLQARLGEALANAGRAVEAAEAFRAAAQSAPAEEALELRRRSAQQFLSGGRIDEGVTAVREVLAAVGLKMQPTPNRALLSLLGSRARLRLRGLSFHERPESALPPLERMRIDTTYSVSLTLGAVDTIRGADFQTRNVLLALEAGEPYRVARALLLEASYAALPGRPGRPRTEMLLGLAEHLAARIQHPHAIAWTRLSRGYAAFLQGRFREAHALFREAEPILREKCRDVAYELDSSNLFALWSQFYLGGIDELCRVLPACIAEARDRGDLAAMINLRTRVAHVTALAADDPARARSEPEEAVQAWSSGGFYAQHYYALYSQASVDLYLGDGAAARARLQAAWPALERSLLLRVQFIHAEALHLRARAALAEAAAASGAARRKLLGRAAADAGRIERMRLDWGGPLARLVRAGAAALDGRRAEAEAEVARAAGELEAADLRLFAAVARRQRGQLAGANGDGTGAAEAAAADAWMQAEGIKSPARFAAVLAPGLD
jgi:hypothetical protein